MEVFTNDEMIKMLNNHIRDNYKSRRDYCLQNSIDPGNLSRALAKKAVITPKMVHPLGYEKTWIPIYTEA